MTGSKMKDQKIFLSANEACQTAGLPVSQGTEQVEKLYPTLVNSYYLSLTDPALGENDPIRKQWHPDLQELEDADSSTDPQAESEYSPVERVIHRYRDRIVLLVTGKCAMRCRFCFRKRTWTTGNYLADITDEQLENAVSYLKKHPEIKEILISGGDPLMLPVERLKTILDTVTAVPDIEIIRVASRLPAVMPGAISQEKIALLSQYPCIWLATHFNHPKELTEEAKDLCRRFVSSGIPVINQTVLLKGVNDNAEILEELFRGLVKLKVKPHYLFHVDPVRGVRHFATGIEKGLDILHTFRSRLSSLAVPTFAIDLPEGGGKIALQPEYRKDGLFPDIQEKKWIEYTLVQKNK